MRRLNSIMSAAATSLLLTSLCRADADNPGKAAYDAAAGALVTVQYTWNFELGPREIKVPGVVVGKDGLVLVTATAFDDRVPEAQIKDVKVLVPRKGAEPLSLDAIFQGRDDRAHVAFVKVDAKHDWAPLKFVADPVGVGDKVYSVGLMDRGGGSLPYLIEANVAATTEGERTTVIADGNLADFGSPVFDAAGRPVGLVDPPTMKSSPQQSEDGQAAAEVQQAGPPTFTEAADFVGAIAKPPTPSMPSTIPWFGTFEMTAIKQAEADYYGILTPAVQVVAIAPDGPAAQAGLNAGDLITTLNGHPLASGETPDQVPGLFRRELLKHAVGDQLKVGVVREKGMPPKELTVKLVAFPQRPSQAPRAWDDALGFGVRDVTMFDRFSQQLKPADRGVIVTVVRPGSTAAASGVPMNALVTQLNADPITDVKNFEVELTKARVDAPHDAIVLLVRRDGRIDTLRLEPAEPAR